MIAWIGFRNYNMIEISKRLTYKWLFTITKAFVDFNGVVPEKFDVVTLNHKINVEYGNVGTDFKYIPREGFGWMNSSYKFGLENVTEKLQRLLGVLVHPDSIVRFE
jgi:alpha,alpha-trehalase